MYNLIMQEYTFKAPVAIAVSEVIIRLAKEFAEQKNAQGIEVLDNLVVDLIMEMSDSYVSFIDLRHYLSQISDAIIKGEDPAIHPGVNRELAGVEENLRDAREAYRKLVRSSSKLYALIPQTKRPEQS